MLISQLNPDTLTREQLTSLLFGGPDTDDDGRPGDCIFVFGALMVTGTRVHKAAELYHQGRAPYLLFSGGDRYGERPQPEALPMKERAVELGVPPEAILTECESNHTTENVIASQLVLDRTIGLHKVRRLLFVSSPYHMRRCWLNLKTYMPPWIEHVWCPATGPDSINPEDWWLDPDDDQRVRREARTLIENVREGRLLDLEVSL